MSKTAKIVKKVDVERRCKAFQYLQEMQTGARMDTNKAKDVKFTQGIAQEYWAGDYDYSTGIFTKTGPAYKYD